MKFPDIDIKHGKWLKRLSSVSLALETSGAMAAAVEACRPRALTSETLLLVDGAAADPFNGLPSLVRHEVEVRQRFIAASEALSKEGDPVLEASGLRRAAWLMRRARQLAGAEEHPEAVVQDHVRSVVRIAECAPALSDEGQFYNVTIEILAGRLAGQELPVVKASHKWVRHVIRAAGGRSFTAYEPTDASGLFATAWIDLREFGVQKLKQLAASDTQRSWNRRLLDARAKPCPFYGGLKCVPCPRSAAECPRGRWARPLPEGRCPVCRSRAKLVAAGLCLPCVMDHKYRRKK